MSRFDYADPGTDPRYCEGISEQRCARCQVMTPVSDLVLVPGVGKVCEECDADLLAEAMAARFPELAKEEE